MSDRIRAALQRLVEALDDYDPKWDAFPEAELTAARAALAEPVGEPAPPAAGEVGELVAFLRRQAAKWQAISREAGLTRSPMAEQFTSAADLLSQHHPVPVPVRERLPGPEDCDGEGRCWWFCTECPGEHPYWILAKEVYCDPIRWLPATALPLPQGEVEP